MGCIYTLPKRFVKIRYFGILTSGYRKQVESIKTKPGIVQLTETLKQRIVRLTGFDPCKCPHCKTGNMQTIKTLPPIRSPVDVLLYLIINLSH